MPMRMLRCPTPDSCLQTQTYADWKPCHNFLPFLVLPLNLPAGGQSETIFVASVIFLPTAFLRIQRSMRTPPYSESRNYLWGMFTALCVSMDRRKYFFFIYFSLHLVSTHVAVHTSVIMSTYKVENIKHHTKHTRCIQNVYEKMWQPRSHPRSYSLSLRIYQIRCRQMKGEI